MEEVLETKETIIIIIICKITETIIINTITIISTIITEITSKINKEIEVDIIIKVDKILKAICNLEIKVNIIFLLNYIKYKYILFYTKYI